VQSVPTIVARKSVRCTGLRMLCMDDMLKRGGGNFKRAGVLSWGWMML
jgi:hypothetical protein